MLSFSMITFALVRTHMNMNFLFCFFLLLAAPRLYVTLILSYIDCSVTRLLVPDEVYFVRRGEYVNRYVKGDE